MNKKRAVSIFIVTLLLMFLAVCAGVLIYAYTMGYLGQTEPVNETTPITITIRIGERIKVLDENIWVHYSGYLPHSQPVIYVISEASSGGYDHTSYAAPIYPYINEPFIIGKSKWVVDKQSSSSITIKQVK